VKTAADKTNPAHFDEFIRTKEDIQLKIIRDKDFDLFLREHGEKRPKDTFALTVDNDVYVRESRMNDEKYLQEAIKHEDYHPSSKLNYSKCEHVVEGFNEVMKYEDIMRDNRVSSDLKSQVCMVDGVYREYAAQQYLMKEIMGSEHHVVGHLVQGEGYLKTHFDEVAGSGEYERIFGRDKKIEDGNIKWEDRMSDADRIEELKNTIRNSGNSDKAKILRNAKNITESGTYDL
jgi:hypothetical protein